MSSTTLPLSHLPEAPARRRTSVLARALFGFIAVLATAIGGAFLLHASIDPAEDTAIGSIRHEALAGLDSWADRARAGDVSSVATSLVDLVVIDPAPSGVVDAAALAARVTALAVKPDGDKRLVLASLTIGEAEDHRGYWNNRWNKPPQVTAVVRRPGNQNSPAAPGGKPADSAASRLVTSAIAPAPLPPWLAEEASERPGNWRVRYWMADWQSVLMGSEGAMLDQILAARFDGVVLDRGDVHAHWAKQHPDARMDMIALVESLARYAREKHPGFLVVLKDADDLLDAARIRNTVDAVIKQDLLLGADGQARPANDRDLATSIALLKRAQRDGLPVMIAEYPANDDSSAAARDRLLAHGFVPHLAQRPDKRRLAD